MGPDLLSCKTLADQQRWLEAITTACARIADAARAQPEAEARPLPSVTKLLLLPAQGAPMPLEWKREYSLPLLPAVPLLLMDTERGGAYGLALLEVPERPGATSLPLKSLQEARPEMPWELRVQVHRWEPVQDLLYLRPLLPTLGCLALAIALLLAGLWKCALLALCASGGLSCRIRQASPPKQAIAFSVEGLEPVEDVSKDDISPLVKPSTAPRWLGKWQLDKSCSQPYEPILADLTVNFVLRKAADAANSVLTLSMDDTAVTVHVKIFVSVEDTLPLDGSWTEKPVPPGAKIKGMSRVRITKLTETEFEFLTEFPGNHGTLLDSLVVSEDGQSFVRVVTRNALSCKRVFRRVPDGS